MKKNLLTKNQIGEIVIPDRSHYGDDENKKNQNEKMKNLTPQEQGKIESLTFLTPPEDLGQPHCARQAIWNDLAVIRRWDWDDNGGRLSNTRHEYEVYEWEGEDEDPAFNLTLGKLVSKFIVPTK